MKVKDCMCKDVTCVKKDTNISEVAKLMGEHHIGCVPVCDEDNNILGIVTDRDVILRSIACDKDVKTTPVEEVMTKNVCTCTQDQDITQAQQLMSDLQVRRLPVVENNQIIGILTLGDLVKNRNISSDEVSDTLEHICCCSKAPKNAE